MKNCFGETPLWECSRKLSAVAMGNEPADLIIKNASLVNVCTNEIIPHTDIAISCGRIALVGDASHIQADRTINAEGAYLAPGFMDGHMHFESSMISVSEYAKAVIPHGTTTVFPDCHEIYNVLGKNGFRYMVEDSKSTPLKTRMVIPSCVPAVPGFEDSGAELSVEDFREMLSMEETVGLGEMMNFPGIINSDKLPHCLVDETLRAGKTVTGHYSIPETDKGLNAYIASGINDCHESTRAEDALAKMRLGMYVMIREGSAWRNMHELMKAVKHLNNETRFCILVSDDNHPETLLKHGHADYLVRRAIEEGIDPIRAIQMVTINCAQCFHLDNEIGSVTPGKCADIVMFDSLEKIDITMTLINGRICAENGKTTYQSKPYFYPEEATKSIHFPGKITADTFRIPSANKSEKVNVIEIVPASTPTIATTAVLQVKNGSICADAEGQDILKAAVIERHNATGKIGYGFVKGFHIKKGAVASTVSHDAHNLFVMGANDEDMAFAANELIKCGGGHIAVENGSIKALVELPIAGLMGNDSVEVMAAKSNRLKHAWIDLGCDRKSPFMTMSILALACIPEIRLTNRGLVDCINFRFLPLITE